MVLPSHPSQPLGTGAGEFRPRQPALKGVRILDLTNLLAGPFATLFLGFLGAEVIKVESKAQLDGARRPPYAYDDPESSPVFNSINLNKMSIQLNLKEPVAVELIGRLASISDVVVENMRPGVMDRLGLGYEALRQANPGIIMASASNGGATGPESSYPGYAAVFNALSGLGHMTGYPDAPPTELRDSIDARVASTTAFAIMTALFHRLRTGEGRFIDLSSREALTVFNAEALMEYLMNGRVLHRMGNRDASMSPHGCYRCKPIQSADSALGAYQDGGDRWVTIAVENDGEWRALCQAAGHPEWESDPRFADPFLRRRNQDALDLLIEEWTQGHTPEEVTEMLQSEGVAASPSMSSADLVEDPHLKARGVWQEVHHPVLGGQRVQGPPWKLSAAQPDIRSAGPLLGQHNRYVFVELLGCSDEEVEQWVQIGIIT